MKTEMLYLSAPELLHAEARLIAISDVDGLVALATDVTPFYAKGGGQPADSGWFQFPDGRRVDVRNVIRDGDGIVWHVVDGLVPDINVNTTIEAKVDPSVRHYHSRLHSAGEAVAAAVHFAGYAHWSVETACHFPGQCRVVFNDHGATSDLEEVSAAIAQQLDAMVDNDPQICLTYAKDLEELSELHRLEEGKHFAEWPVRLVSPKDSFWRPCMGTHVERLSEVGPISLRKVKRKKGAIAVGYDID